MRISLFFPFNISSRLQRINFCCIGIVSSTSELILPEPPYTSLSTCKTCFSSTVTVVSFNTVSMDLCLSNLLRRASSITRRPMSNARLMSPDTAAILAEKDNYYINKVRKCLFEMNSEGAQVILILLLHGNLFQLNFSFLNINSGDYGSNFDKFFMIPARSKTLPKS